MNQMHENIVENGDREIINLLTVDKIKPSPK